MKATKLSGKQGQNLYQHRMSRREFMRTAALLGVSLGATTIAAQCNPSAPTGATSATSRNILSTSEGTIDRTSSVTQPSVSYTSQMEIYSWWGGGNELASLQALYAIYNREYPEVEIINAGVADTAGLNTRDIMNQRLQNGNPPDSFQIHLGRELIDTYAIPGFMEPLDFLYEAEGWNDISPSDLLSIASWDGHPWSVPVNIHRSNVLWCHSKLFQEAGIDTPPETIDEFITAAARLKDAGYAGLSFGESGPGFTANTFENILPAFMTPDQYRGLWSGDTDWGGPEVETALIFLKEVLENFANEDYLQADWMEATLHVERGEAGMLIMGDWQPAWFAERDFSDYIWAPVMDTQGTWVLISDSFGLPKGAPHRENVVNWLRVIGSKEGQENFNVIKGSIPARTDIDPTKFDAYQQSAMKDFAVDELVPSVVHGAAANNAWADEFVMALNTFAHNKDISQARENLIRACEEFGACQSPGG